MQISSFIFIIPIHRVAVALRLNFVEGVALMRVVQTIRSIRHPALILLCLAQVIQSQLLDIETFHSL